MFKCLICENESTVDLEKCPKCTTLGSYEEEEQTP